jgi:hypothetical protein
MFSFGIQKLNAIFEADMIISVGEKQTTHLFKN